MVNKIYLKRDESFVPILVKYFIHEKLVRRQIYARGYFGTATGQVVLVLRGRRGKYAQNHTTQHDENIHRLSHHL